MWKIISLKCTDMTTVILIKASTTSIETKICLMKQIR